MTILSTISTEVKSHLFAAIVIVALIAGSVYVVDSLIARHDAKTESKYELLLTQAQTKSTADQQAFQNVLTQLSAQNAALSTQIASRDVALATILKQDAQLNASQVAAKLGGTANSDNNIVLPLDTSRNIAASLDILPPLQANLANETTIATNLQTELTAQTTVVTDLKAQLVASDNSCKAQIKTLKAKQRKTNLKFLAVGIGIGIGFGHWLGF